MKNSLSRLIDDLSNFLVNKKGLLPIIGLLLIMINLIIVLINSGGWLAQTNLFLHLGLITAIIGFLIAWVL